MIQGSFNKSIRRKMANAFLYNNYCFKKKKIKFVIKGNTVIVDQSAFKNLVPGIYTCITQNNLIEFGLRWNQRGFKETFINILCSKPFCTELLLRSRFDTVA